jgi:hypothetical protein
LDVSLAAIRKEFKDRQDRIDVPEDRKFTGLDAYQKAIDSGVDLVLICSPPGFHPLQFEAAVKAGSALPHNIRTIVNGLSGDELLLREPDPALRFHMEEKILDSLYYSDVPDYAELANAAQKIAGMFPNTSMARAPHTAIPRKKTNTYIMTKATTPITRPTIPAPTRPRT